MSLLSSIISVESCGGCLFHVVSAAPFSNLEAISLRRVRGKSAEDEGQKDKELLIDGCRDVKSDIRPRCRCA